MESVLLHQSERGRESEQHLKDNGKKFSRHCNFVLGLMYQGHRLTARQLERDYNVDGRRLRDIYANRKECKREWKRYEDGRTAEMEYWLEIPKQPTKSVLQKWWDGLQKEPAPVVFMQPKPISKDKKPTIIQQPFIN